METVSKSVDWMSTSISDTAVDRLYRELLIELKIPANRILQLSSLPTNQKRVLLYNDSKYKLLQANKTGLTEAASCVSMLDHALGTACDGLNFTKIIDFRAKLEQGLEDDKWIKLFFELRGLDKLMQILSIFEEMNLIKEQIETLKCLKCLMNNDLVIEALASSPEAVCQVTFCLNSKQQQLDCLVIEILLVAALYSCEGYDAVMYAFQVYRMEMEEPVLYFTLTNFLRNEDSNLQEKATTLALINTLINSAPTLESRLSIRRDFTYSELLIAIDDLDGMISLLRNDDDEKDENEGSQINLELNQIQKQIEVYRKVETQDQEEVVVLCKGHPLSNIEELFNFVNKYAIACGKSNELLEILHAIYVIPPDEQVSAQIWTTLADTCQWLVTAPARTCSMSFAEIVEKVNERAFSSNGSISQNDSNDGEEKIIIQKLKESYETRISILEEENKQLKEAKHDCSSSASKNTSSSWMEDPKFIKYAKMKKAGLPLGAINNAMTRDGVEPPKDLFTSDQETKENVDEKSAPKVDPKYEKYFRMQKTGLPEGAIRNAMQRDGVDPSGFTGFNSSDTVTPTAAVKLDPKYEKYAKMRKAKIPEGAIQNAMLRDGVDPSGFPGIETSEIPEVKKAPLPLKNNIKSKELSGNEGQRQRSLSNLPEKPKVQTRVPMRGLFWSKLPESKVEGTLWENLQEDTIKIDLDNLEELFAQKQPKKSQKTPRKKAFSPTSANDSVQLIDPKRQQNVGIAIARFKMKPDQIKETIINLDTKAIGGSDRVIMLQGVVPTPDEIHALQEFKGDVSKLSKVESLFYTLMTIPRCKQRIEAWRVKVAFHVEVVEVQERMQVLSKACGELQNSRALRKTLEVVLALGNHLNGTSTRGGAYGFKLESLKQLSSIKGADNKTTLLQYLVCTLGMKRYTEILTLAKELHHIPAASEIPYAIVKKKMNELNKDLRFLQNEVESCKKEQEKSTVKAETKKWLSQFLEIMEPFTDKMALIMNVAQGQLDSLTSTFDSILSSYGEPKQRKLKSEEFFKIFKDFIADFETEKLQHIHNEQKERKDKEKVLKRNSTVPTPKGDSTLSKLKIGRQFSTETDNSQIPGRSKSLGFNKLLSKASDGNTDDILDEMKKRQDMQGNRTMPLTPKSARNRLRRGISIALAISNGNNSEETKLESTNPGTRRVQRGFSFSDISILASSTRPV